MRKARLGNTKPHTAQYCYTEIHNFYKSQFSFHLAKLSSFYGDTLYGKIIQ